VSRTEGTSRSPVGSGCGEGLVAAKLARDRGAMPPSGAARSFSKAFPALPESVRAVRHAIVQFATRIGVPEATIAAVQLAVSEAATNVVVHAYDKDSEPGVMEVAVAETAGELWVIVADGGSGLRPRTDSPGLGLGLGLIAQVSDGVDLVQRASGGLELRMRVLVPPPEVPAGA
jgi:serine/threonine-protein kinase RsbW